MSAPDFISDAEMAALEGGGNVVAPTSAPSFISDDEMAALEGASAPKPDFQPYKGPTLFDDPVGALMSSDWWLTRPSGEKISAQQAVVGPASRALDALTFGLGDEVTAAGSAALGGNYDQELAKVRGYQNSFSEASPVVDTGLQLAAGLKVPVPSGPMTVGKTAGLGAGYGAAYGFGEGEGGLQNRIEAAKDDALIGGGVGAGLGVVAKGVQALANNAPEIAARLQRRSIGTRQGDYAKTANEIGIIGLPDGELETLTKSAVDDLISSGKLGDSRDPSKLLTAAKEGEKSIDAQIATVVSSFDKNVGEAVHPQFDNALSYLAEGKVPADKVDDYFKRLTKLSDNIKSEGQGKLSYLQQQKIAQGRLFDPNDTTLNGFNNAIYYDLQNAIESKVPEIAGLNKESQKYKIVKPILQRGLSIAENKDDIEAIKGAIKTTGGYGALMLGGSAAGGLPGVAAGAAIGKAISVMNSPSGKKNIANTIQGLGKLAEKSPEAKSLIASMMASVVGTGEPSSETSPSTYPTQARSGSLQQNTERLLLNSSSNPTPKTPSNLSAKLKEIVAPEKVNDFKLLKTLMGGDMAKTKTEIEAEIDADPFYALAYQLESGRGKYLKNPKSSAKGAFQLIDSTAKKLGVKDPMDLEQNFEGFKKLTEEHRKEFGDDPRLLYAAHFLGSTTLRKLLAGKPLSEEQQSHVEEFQEKLLPKVEKFLSKYDQVEA